MNPFDLPIVHFINSFARHSPTFDALVVFIDRNELTKGGLLMAALWWGWFKPRENQDRAREAILAAMMSGFAALILGHLLGHVLPFRLRPLHEPALHFALPYGARPYDLKAWSSFPSQHTLFYIALGVGMLSVSWMVGTYIICHTLLFIAGPRMYLGLHYPSDIIAGALIAVPVALTMNAHAIRDRYAPRLLEWQKRHPAAFYAGFFLLTLELSSMFQGLLEILKLILLGPSRTG